MHRIPLLAVLPVALSAIPACGEPAPAWGHPAEVMSAKGERMPWPVEVVRGASGGVGVFVFEREVGLTMRWSKDGRAPWKVLLLPNGAAGEPVTEGDRVEIPLADEDARTVSVAAFDLAEGKELSRTAIPGALPRLPSFSRLAAGGTGRHLLLTTAAGELFHSRAEGDGTGWRAWAPAGRTAARGESSCPPLLVAEDGAHTMFVGEGGKLAHRVADAQGAWKDGAEVPQPDAEHGVPLTVAGAQNGSQFHLVLLTARPRFLYTWSDDGGAHWAKWTVAAAPPKDALGTFDVAASFRLKCRGRVALLAWTERGEREADPFAVRALVSRTSGSKWEEFSPGAGLRGSSGLPAVFIGEDGGITAAVACAPGVRSGARYVLVRGTRAGPDAGNPPEAEWWGR